MIYSLENEQSVIVGLLKYPHLLPDIEPIVSENDFEEKDNYHKVIFSVIKNATHEDKALDLLSLANEISGISISSDFHFYDYLDSLQQRNLSEKGLIEAAKKLKTVSVRREIAETCGNIIKTMRDSNDKNFDQIISIADELYGSATRNYYTTNDPIDLFGSMQELIEGNGNEADDESVQIECPYENFQKLFGGFFPGDLVVFASAPKCGKSTLLMNMLKECSRIGVEQKRPIKTLLLDTEMEYFRIARRICSEMSGVNEFFIKTNKWRKSPEMVKAIRSVWPQVEKLFNTIQHIYVGNAETAELLSICRRWAWKNLRSVNSGIKEKRDLIRGLIALDYFKITSSDNVKDAFHSSMALGYRVDATKKLASELFLPIISSCQTNANNEVGLSREISKFVSSLHMFDKKSAEDLAEDDCGATHKLTPKFTRDQGEFAAGFNDLIKVEAGKGRFEYKPNYINYKLEKFRVTEMEMFSERVKLMQHDTGVRNKKKIDQEEEYEF